MAKHRNGYSVGTGRPFAPNLDNHRKTVYLDGKTFARVQKMAEAHGLPAGLLVAAAIDTFAIIPSRRRTAHALKLIGVP